MLVPATQVVNPKHALAVNDQRIVGPLSFLAKEQVGEALSTDFDADSYTGVADNFYLHWRVWEIALNSNAYLP